MQWIHVTVVLGLAVLWSCALGQDSDSSNEDSPVLLTLTQGSEDKDKASSEAPSIISLNEPEKDYNEANSEVSSAAPPPNKQTEQPFRPFAPAPAPSSRPSLIQSFLAGRGGAAATGRASPLADLARNFNVTGRLSTLRTRIGRFRIPRLETNEKSFAYRAGRKVGLFFQSIGKRARALAERLRARAATATPTAT